jgi:hypothetical protein
MTFKMWYVKKINPLLPILSIIFITYCIVFIIVIAWCQKKAWKPFDIKEKKLSGILYSIPIMVMVIIFEQFYSFFWLYYSCRKWKIMQMNIYRNANELYSLEYNWMLFCRQLYLFVFVYKFISALKSTNSGSQALYILPNPPFYTSEKYNLF